MTDLEIGKMTDTLPPEHMLPEVLKGVMEATEEELAAECKDVLEDPERVEIYKRQIKIGYFGPVYPEFFPNMLNDLYKMKNKLPLENIKVPVLITHGDKDKQVPMEIP